MSQQVSAFRNRLQVDTAARDGITEQLHGGSPFFWNGSATQFEIGLFRKETIIDDVSNLSSMTLEIKALDANGVPTGAALMTKSVGAPDLKKDLTADLWTGGAQADCHASFFFTGEEAELDLGGLEEKQFWMVITAVRASDSEPITVGCSLVTVAEDGSSLANPSSAGELLRFNLGYPELLYSDGTWHRISPVQLGDGQYDLDITQAASGATADFNADHFRTNEGYPELLYDDASWHRLLPIIAGGTYEFDVDQTASASYTANSDHFRTHLGYPELQFADDTWHRLKPVKTGDQYTITIEQTNS